MVFRASHDDPRYKVVSLPWYQNVNSSGLNYRRKHEHVRQRPSVWYSLRYLFYTDHFVCWGSHLPSYRNSYLCMSQESNLMNFTNLRFNTSCSGGQCLASQAWTLQSGRRFNRRLYSSFTSWISEYRMVVWHMKRACVIPLCLLSLAQWVMLIVGLSSRVISLLGFCLI